MFLVVDGAARVHTGLPLPSPTADPEDEDGGGGEGGGGGGGGDEGAWRAWAARAGERIVGKGDVFGEGGLFTRELGLFRRESAQAASWLSVYVLDAPALDRISLEYPEVLPSR